MSRYSIFVFCFFNGSNAHLSDTLPSFSIHDAHPARHSFERIRLGNIYTRNGYFVDRAEAARVLVHAETRDYHNVPMRFLSFELVYTFLVVSFCSAITLPEARTAR